MSSSDNSTGAPSQASPTGAAAAEPGQPQAAQEEGRSLSPADTAPQASRAQAPSGPVFELPAAASPRIQALIEREVPFPDLSRKMTSEERWRLWRQKRFEMKSRVTLWSIITLVPRRLWGLWTGLTQPGLFVVTFIAMVALGTAGMYAVPFFVRGAPLTLLDAVFMMTSAVSLTGLSPMDISSRLTFWGQLWLLLFIQIGGLGVLTFSTQLICAIGQKLSSRGGEVLASSLFASSAGQDIRQTIRRVLHFSLAVEGAAALLLWPFLVDKLSLKEIAAGLWRALFLAVVSFCNSSYTLFPDSLGSLSENPFVLLVVTTLVVLGGAGFLVMEELRRWRQDRKRLKGSQSRLSLNALIVVMASPLLFVGGTALFLLFEWSGALGQMGPLDSVMNAWTLSVMTRSAGMSTIDPWALSNSSLFLSVVLMFIGGASGSMAGGIKLTTFAVLAGQAISGIRGQRYVSLFGRSIPDQVLERAGTIALIAFALISSSVFLLGFGQSGAVTLDTGRQDFLPVLFESVSALSNTGLSLGYTPSLTPFSKVVVIILMFIGRVGMLAFFSAISLREKSGDGSFRPAVENVFLG